MAKVEVDLTEYDEMRNARKNAEERIKELKLELEVLKKSQEPNNVLVKNIYMKKDIDIQNITREIAEHIRNSYSLTLMDGMFLRTEVASIAEACVRIGMERAKSVVDYTNTEVRGFNELQKEIRQTLEDNYKTSMETKERQLEESKKKYDEKYEKLEEEFGKKYKELEEKRKLTEDLQESARSAIIKAENKIKEYENKNWFKRLFKL